MIHFMNLIHLVYNFLWGDLITIPLPGGSSLGLFHSAHPLPSLPAFPGNAACLY